MAVSVQARDGDLILVGPMTWSKVDLTARYNAVGSWSVTLPATPQNYALADISDLGVVIDWNGVYRFSGYMETWNPSKSVDDTGKVTETITISGADDLGLIANRDARPAPASAWSAQTVSSSDAKTDKLETVIKYFVNRNAGPAALAGRRAPHLTIATDLARGGTVSFTARFGDGIDLALMNIIRLLVASGGPMGVFVTQVGSDLVFDCYEPRDLTSTAWFSVSLGNLRSVTLTDTTPTATNALVRGSTTFIEVTSADSANPWRYAESIVDQSSSTDSTEMTQAGTDAIAQGAGAAQLQIATVDLPKLAFGTDYGLGDMVTVEIRDGVTYPDIISAVQLVVDATGGAYTEAVTPTVGAAGSDSASDATATAKLAAEVRRLAQAIKRLQS